MSVGFAVRPDKPALENQSRQYADRKGATTKSEQINPVPGLVVATQERVKFLDIVSEAETDSESKQLQRLEALGADAVIIHCDLPSVICRWRVALVDRLIKTPYIGLERICRAVAGPIRQDHDILRHGLPLLLRDCTRSCDAHQSDRSAARAGSTGTAGRRASRPSVTGLSSGARAAGR